MRVLFLDDMDDRWNEFVSRVTAIDVLVHRAVNADEAIKMLNEGEYDFIFLDHDLDPGAYVGKPEEKTGMDVVDFIVKHAYAYKGAQICVHSLNTPAANRMCSALREADLAVSQVPFAWRLVSFNA